MQKQWKEGTIFIPHMLLKKMLCAQIETCVITHWMPVLCPLCLLIIGSSEEGEEEEYEDEEYEDEEEEEEAEEVKQEE